MACSSETGLKAHWDGMLFLGDKTRGELNSIGDDWYEMEVLVDSGACETVMPVDVAKHIKIHESPGSQAGQEYEVASGAPVDNVGERRCMVSTEGSEEDKLMVFQVVDKIKKPLLSVTKVADMGFECVLGRTGGYILDTKNGEKLPVERRGNLYVLRC